MNWALIEKADWLSNRVLANPVYAGLVRVEAFKDLPGGLSPAIHEAIIDKTTLANGTKQNEERR